MARAIGRAAPGDFSLTDGRLSRGGDLVYTGAQIIKTDLLADMPKGAFSLNLLWDRMIDRGRLSGIFHDGRWCDVGHPAGLKTAERMLEGAGLA